MPPRISIVTPSYNQGRYLEETIVSVLDQGYPDLEYVVMDGGSSDNSVDIIKKYEPYLAYWRSAPDQGQGHSIAEGFEMSTGSVLAWLNSDDRYEPGTLWTVAENFVEYPETELLYGDYTLVYPGGHHSYRRKISFDFNICLYVYLMVPQPSAFWTRDIYQRVGGLDPRWRYVMDYDLFLRIGDACQGRTQAIRHIRQSLALFRVHASSKSVKEMSRFKPEQKLLKSNWVTEPKLVYELKQRYYTIKLALRFLRERGAIPLRKPPGKY